MNPEEKARLINQYIRTGNLAGFSDDMLNEVYVRECEKIGLDVFSRPFDVIAFKNGGLRLYMTAHGVDTLAAIHSITRTTIHAPCVKVFASIPLVYCQVDAVLRTGRRQSATATLPLVNSTIATDLMKVETKAERRATLKIMGVAAILEDDLSSIPTVKLPANEPKLLDPDILSIHVQRCLASHTIISRSEGSKEAFSAIAGEFAADSGMSRDEARKVLSAAVMKARESK